MTAPIGKTKRFDVAIVGAGAVGLALAWELSRRGKSVVLLDASEPGMESSWAGAGILPPCLVPGSRDPLGRLHRLSLELHPIWAERLREETGIDVGFRPCGGVYLAFDRGEAAALSGLQFEAESEGSPFENWTLGEIARREPALAPLVAHETPVAACFFPGECQIRNPRFVKALTQACVKAGVELRACESAESFDAKGGTIEALSTGASRQVVADAFVAAAGAWTAKILAPLGLAPEIFPIRGQMLLYDSPSPRLRSIVNVGSRYLVPRDDGALLVGSTEEEVGFEKANTPEGIAELRRFAERVLPSLAQVEPVRTWCGFRPATFDGFPYLGRAPGWKNLFVAAGHFRAGLTLAPASAVALADEICGQTPAVDLRPFRIGR